MLNFRKLTWFLMGTIFEICCQESPLNLNLIKMLGERLLKQLINCIVIRKGLLILLTQGFDKNYMNTLFNVLNTFKYLLLNNI